MRLSSFIALCVVSILPAAAQTNPSGTKPPPHLAYVYPAGAQQGTEITLSLGGQNLTDAQFARITGPGITARITGYERPLNQKELVALREEIQQLQRKRTTAKADFTPADEKKLSELNTRMARGNNRQASPALAETLTLTLSIAADASPGTRELRLRTATGLSNPLVFQIGTLPEVTAPVMTPTSPEATKGKRSAIQQASSAPPTQLHVTLPTVVNGQILPGEVDRIHFTARRGQALIIAANARALIPYLADAVPGWFQATLSLRDARGQELAYDDDFQFRPDPVLACTIPTDGDYTVEIKDAIYRGREDFVYRLALGELPFVQSVFPLGTTQQHPIEVALTGWNLPAKRLPVDPRHDSPGIAQLSVKKNGTSANLIRFAIGTGPELTEDEKSAPDSSTPVSLPITINGRISHPDERDEFTFLGHAGEGIVAEIIARRLDSPLDSHLALLDDTGQAVATNDDFDDKTEGLLTHQADSRLQITLPHDGRYHLMVTDTQHHGGPDYSYRLSLRPPQPDFALRVTPSAVNLPLFGSVPITVFAVRQDGFTGEIQLALADSTSGYRLSGNRIPAGQDVTTLTLTAPSMARNPIDTLRLIGTAVILGQPITHSATPADDTMQAFLYKHLVPARSWEAVVTGRATPFRILNKQPVTLVPGKPTLIRLAAPGLPRGIEDLKVELLNPPTGISIGNCEARSEEIQFTLLCDPSAPNRPTTGNLIVSLAGRRPHQKSGTPKNITNLGTAPAIAFAISAP